MKNFRHMKIFGHWLNVDLWRMLVMLRCFGHYEGPTCLSCTGEPGHLLTGMLLTWQKASARVHKHDAKVALLSPTCNNILPARLFNRINFEILVYVKNQTRRAPGSLTGLIYWLTACAAAIILTGELKKNLYHTNATAKDAISDNTIEAATGPIGKGAYPIYMEIASKLKINISTVATCLVSI